MNQSGLFHLAVIPPGSVSVDRTCILCTAAAPWDGDSVVAAAAVVGVLSTSTRAAAAAAALNQQPVGNIFQPELSSFSRFFRVLIYIFRNYTVSLRFSVIL